MQYSSRRADKVATHRIFALTAALMIAALPVCCQTDPAATWLRVSGPETLSYEELTKIAVDLTRSSPLRAKVDRVLQTPFVATNTNASPSLVAQTSYSTASTPILRVAEWNFERGLEFDSVRSMLVDRQAYLQELSAHADKDRVARVNGQIDLLQTSDLLILNEVDAGMPRTGYRPIARDFARTMNMNYAFGAEFLELEGLAPESVVPDPTPGLEDKERRELEGRRHIDASQYLGLHGNAILTRLPIARAEVFRLPVCYDWYDGEKESISYVEKGKRRLARTVFAEHIDQEIREGGRNALIVDLTLPSSPTGQITVVNVHLEDKCKPKCRRKQMDAVLQHIAGTNNPVILAGDLNTNNADGRPTSLARIINGKLRDWQFWVKVAFRWTAVPPLIYFDINNYYRNYQDPTGINIPIFFSNREHGLFRDVRRQRFPNEYRIDFRGAGPLTPRAPGAKLANSNERAWKGFEPSYLLARTYGGLVGRYRLDWIFVKPFITDPSRRGQSFLFAPVNPHTLDDLNDAGTKELSDHLPITVDLYLQEPRRPLR